MKTKLNGSRIALIAFCASALSAASVWAGTPSPTMSELAVIKSVDAKAHQLVLANPKSRSEREFQWNDQTKFMERSQAASADVLQAGERVHVTYAVDAGKATLQRVTLLTGKPPMHAPEASSSHEKK